MAEKLHVAKVKIIPEIPIPDKYRRGFKSAIEVLATDTNVPAALIMRLGREKIEVFATNTHEKNPYEVGASEHLKSGLYCETVIKTGQCLIIPDATKDENWKNNPDIKFNMIAYLGLPLCWPGGELFGTVCILNSREHHFGEVELEFIKAVHDAVEADLAEIYKEYCKRTRFTPNVVEASVASRL